MKALPLIAIAALLAGASRAAAAPAFTCTGAAAEEFETVCADSEIIRLDRAVDAALRRRLAGADPLTATLLKRDQRWFNDTLDGHNIGAFGDPANETRQRMIAALEARLAAIGRLGSEVVRTPAGEWANAFGTAKVEDLGDGALRVAVTATAVYVEASEAIEKCGATAELKRETDGWYAGTAVHVLDDDADDKASKDATDQTTASPFRMRLRLQANTLRIVIMPSEQDTFCPAPEQVTGTYFAVGPGTSAPASTAAARALIEARTTNPSFACATAKNSDEEEICSDPELAARDVEIGRAYREALRRLDAKSANFLREDQRASVKENAIAFETELNPSWDKRAYFVHHTGNARDALFLRLRERLAMLTNLEPGRQGVTGLWLGHNAILSIAPDPESKDRLRALGRKWQTGDYKAHCDFEATGRLVGGAFRTDDSFPTLTREGASLVTDAAYPDVTRDREFNRKVPQPDYCSRMDSAKARLFPVKPNAAINPSDGRIR